MEVTVQTLMAKIGWLVVENDQQKAELVALRQKLTQAVVALAKAKREAPEEPEPVNRLNGVV